MKLSERILVVCLAVLLLMALALVLQIGGLVHIPGLY